MLKRIVFQGGANQHKCSKQIQCRYMSNIFAFKVLKFRQCLKWTPQLLLVNRSVSHVGLFSCGTNVFEREFPDEQSRASTDFCILLNAQ